MIISLNRGGSSKSYSNWSYCSGHHQGLICHSLAHQIPPTRVFLKGPPDVGSVPELPPHTMDMSPLGRITCVHARADEEQLFVFKITWLSQLGRQVWMAVMQHILSSYSFWPSLPNGELQHRQKDQSGGVTNWKTVSLQSNSPSSNQKRSSTRISQVYCLGFYAIEYFN